jgi:glycosyltransferase involved in cell wall biosynthesis
MYPKNAVSGILNAIVQATLQFLRGVGYLSKCKSCDVIHYQQSSYSLGILPLLPIMFIPTSNKKIVTAHDFDRTWGLLRVAKMLQKQIYNKADRVIVHSDEMRKDLISIGTNASKITVIPHGAKIPTLVSRSRSEITFFGAPVKDKGVLVLFEALRILKEKGEKIEVHFYGIYSELEKESADSYAEELGVKDCVFWGGRLSENEFDRKMQESMFTFAVYTKPVSGSSILTRAMANATPVIGTNIGGMPEYSKDFSALIPPNDPKALADAISRLMKDPDLRKNLGNGARRHALEISWDVIARRNLNVYLDVLKH